MPKVKLNLDELHDGEITWISLVERGANRTPIKLTKADESEDDGMIDLAKKLFQKTPAQKDNDAWGVAAVVIRKDTDSQKLIAKIHEIHGISSGDIEETEDAYILKQEGYQKEDDSLVALKLNDDVAVFLSNAKKFFDPFSDSTDFNENMATAGFFPGMQMSFEAMMKTAMGIMRTSEKKKEARQKLETALGDFNKFVMGLAQNLPETAFKLEEITKADCGCDHVTTGKIEDADDRAANEGDNYDTCPPGQVRADDGTCVTLATGDVEDLASAVDDPTPSDLELKAQKAEDDAMAARKAADDEAEAAKKAEHPGGCPEGQHRVNGRCVPNAPKAKSPANPDENNANTAGPRNCPEGQALVDGRCVPVEVGATTQPPPPVGTGAGEQGAETGEMLKTEGLEKFLAQIQEVIQKATEPLNKEIQGVRKDVQETQDRLSKAEKTAQAASNAVKGTVTGADRVAQEDLGMPNHDTARKDDGAVEVWKNTELDKLWNTPLEELRG